MFAAASLKSCKCGLESIRAFEAALSPIERFEANHTVSDEFYCTAFSKNVNYFETTELRILVWGEINNTLKLFELLSDTKDSEMNSAALVSLAWEKWGENFPKYLIGDFAIALFFKRSKKVVLVRDAIGIRPLFYSNDGEQTICATTPKAILLASRKSFKKNKKWIARYLIDQFASADQEETAYEKLLKVKPGHIVILEGGKITINEPWKTWINAPTITYVRDQKFVDQHRKRFVKAVHQRCPKKGVVGVESSAGIDSSSIVATACDLLAPEHKSRVVCFGFADTPLTNTLIHELSDNIGGLETLVTTTENSDLRDSSSEYALDLLVMGFPISHSNYIDGEVLKSYRGRRGMKVVLSGFGGDEVATSFAKPITKELIDLRDWQNLYSIQKGNFFTKSLRVLRRIWADVAQRNEVQDVVTSEPRDKNIYNWKTIQKFNLEKLVAGVEDLTRSFRTINEEIIESEIPNPNVANRLECHTIYAHAYGVEYRWPMLDEELVQNYLDTPSIEKYGPNGTTRYLHKRAMHGIVPDSINWRTSKALGPHYFSEEAFKQSVAHLLKETQEVMDSLHPDLLEFVQPNEIQAILDRFEINPPNRKELAPYVEPFSSLGALNYWFKNGH